MMDLITEHIATWTGAEIPQANGGRGRGRGANGQSPHGIKKLRELILELAVRGKLVPQDPNDEPASVLLEKIVKEKAKLNKKGKIKKQKLLPEISEDEITFGLPKNWKLVRLGEIGEWAIGTGFPKREQGLDGLEVLFSKVSDMNLDGNEKYIFTTVNTISEKTAARLKINVHHKGTVIFPKIGGAIATNKRRIIVKPTAIDNNCLGITPAAGIDTNYLYLYLTSLDLSKYQVGTSVPALSQGTLELILLGLPPIAEQHRIVAKVDELMALCDKLEQQQTDSNDTHQTLVETLLATLTTVADPAEFALSWQRIVGHFDTLFTTEESIDQLKQTILQLAVMGKLVPQDPNDEPAGTLLEKIAKEKARLIKEGKIKKQTLLPKISEDEKPFELPVGWEWARIGDATLFTEYGMSEQTFDGIDGVPVLKMGDIQDGKVVLGGQKMVAGDVESLPALYLKKWDLLYNRTNSAELVGKTGIYEGPDDAYTFASYLIRIRCSEKFLHPLYCNLAMNTSLFRKTQIEPHLKQQCGQANVNGTILKNMIIPISPLAEQHRIVAKVDELMALCDTLKERLHDAQITQVQLADAIVEQAVA